MGPRETYIVVEDGGDVVGRELVGGVGDEEAGLYRVGAIARGAGDEGQLESFGFGSSVSRRRDVRGGLRKAETHLSDGSITDDL